MAEDFHCGHCGHRWEWSDPVPPSRCPECGASLSAVVREALVPVGPAPNESTPGSGVNFNFATPSNPADDPVLIESATPNKYNCGDSDSSLKTTVFDFIPRPSSSLPELTENLLPGLGSPAPECPSSESVVPDAATVSSSASSRRAAATGGGNLLSSPSPFAFKLALSYGSAITLVCLYLAYLLSQKSPTLDLPDLAPPAKAENRVTTLLYVPRETELHPAQRIQLGESQQYGSLRVTPIAITRGPVVFDYFDPLAGETRPPSAPVLKLFLKFENVSSDQEVVPLDRQLVFTKEPDRANFGWFKANNFVRAVEDHHDYDRHVLVFDLSPESEWQIRGENLDYPLKPGESVVAFIPTTEEGWDKLSGSLVWRVHMRKGYNPDSGRGVTTLIEVLFDSDDIVCDANTCCKST